MVFCNAVFTEVLSGLAACAKTKLCKTQEIINAGQILFLMQATCFESFLIIAKI